MLYRWNCCELSPLWFHDSLWSNKCNTTEKLTRIVYLCICGTYVIQSETTLDPQFFLFLFNVLFVFGIQRFLCDVFSRVIFSLFVVHTATVGVMIIENESKTCNGHRHAIVNVYTDAKLGQRQFAIGRPSTFLCHVCAVVKFSMLIIINKYTH